MGYVVSGIRGPWGRLHRDDVTCDSIRRSKSLRPATEEETDSLQRCRTCFPEGFVKRMLIEEGVLFRKAQRLADETAPGIVAMLVDLTKGERP